MDFKDFLGKRCLWYDLSGHYYFESYVEEISPSGEYVKVGTRVSDWYPIKDFTEARFIEELPPKASE